MPPIAAVGAPTPRDLIGPTALWECRFVRPFEQATGAKLSHRSLSRKTTGSSTALGRLFALR